jgi:GntR family transcriptional repressor for pyruvate dehydrogenase complex
VPRLSATMHVVVDDRKLQAFRPIRLRKAADEVAVVLVDAIRGGLYAPGQRLPRERDLAARLDVSRATLREAIAVLAQAGAVSVRRGPGGGIFVESPANLGHLLGQLHNRPGDSVRSIMEVRRALELQALLLAAERATAHEIEQLWELVARLETLVHADAEFVALSIQFHLRIAEISKNQTLADFVRQVFAQYELVREKYPVGHIELEWSIEIHKRLVRAIESRDNDEIIAAHDERLGSIEEYLLGERLKFP